MRATADPALTWRLFRLYPGEGRRVVVFSLLAALIQMGAAMGFTAADALFLTHVGVQGLPLVYLLTPVVMVVYVPAHTYLLGRLGIDRVLGLTFGVLALGSACVWWAAGSAPVPLTYYAAKLFSVLWWIGLYSLYWNWMDGFFDIQDAKRVYSLFSAGEAAGGVAGGALAAFLVQVRPVEDLFLLWAILALLTIPAAALIRRREHRLEIDLEDEAPRGFLAQTRRTVGAMRASPFVLVLGAGLVIGLFVVTVTEYQYLGILSQGVGAEELAVLLGTLLALVCVFNVAVNLFFFNRLVLGIGVRNVALIAAGAYLAVFVLLLLQGGAVAAVFGFFTCHGILASIEYNNQNFLFHAAPDNVRREVRTILEGLAEPMATALGGGFLLWAATRLSPAQISTVGLGIAVVYLACVFLLRRHYGPSLVANLRRRWLDLSRPSQEVLSGLPAGEVATLHDFTSHPDPGLALSALRILWMNDCSTAVEEMLRFLRERPPEDRPRARDLVGSLLDRADPEVAGPLTGWILDNIRDLDPGFMEDLGARGLVPPAQVKALLGSDDPDEVAAAVVVLWRSTSPGERRSAVDALLRLLAGELPRERAAGVRVLGYLSGDPLSQEAVRWIDDADPEVRFTAVSAVRRTAAEGATELVSPLLAVLSGSERMAFIALEALARIADPSAIPSILRRADAFTPNVRRIVVRVLDQMGLKGVPQSVAALRDPAIPLEGRILAARSLARLAPGQLDVLAPEIQKIEVARAREFRTRVCTLTGMDGPGNSVLRRCYQDQLTRVTDYVLELLSVAGRIPDYQMLRRWLRSGTVKERAEAIETLDQALGREEFARLAPLLEPRNSGVPDGPVLPIHELLERSVNARMGVGSAAAAMALWERDPASARSHFTRVLQHEPSALLRDTILDLLDPSPRSTMGVVRMLHHLEGARFFEELPLLDVTPMVLAGRERACPAGQYLVHSGETVAELMVLVSGTARVLPGQRDVEAGGLLGVSALLNDRRAREDVVSRGCRVLSIPRAAVMAAAERSVAVAHALFSLREEVMRGAAA